MNIEEYLVQLRAATRSALIHRTQKEVSVGAGVSRQTLNKFLNGAALGPKYRASLEAYLKSLNFWDEYDTGDKGIRVLRDRAPERTFKEQTDAISEASRRLAAGVPGRFDRSAAARWFSVSMSQFDKVIRPHLGNPIRDTPTGQPYWALDQLQAYIDKLKREQWGADA